jgi:hypothetical protein
VTGRALPNAAGVLRTNPIQHLTLRRASKRLGPLLEVGVLPRLRSLHLGAVDPADLRALASGPHLARLRELRLHDQALADVRHLAASTSLTTLDFDGVAHPPPPAPTGPTLSLETNERLGPEQGKLLADWPGLRHLRLGGGRQLGVEFMRLLARSPHLAGLRGLDLLACTFDPGAAEALAGAPWLGGLTSLSLYGVGTAAARLLMALPALAGLTELDLGGNGLGYEGARTLARSPRRRGLRKLRLAYNGITGQGALQLADSPHLEQLDLLDLTGNFIGPQSAGVLRQRFGDRVDLRYQRL